MPFYSLLIHKSTARSITLLIFIALVVSVLASAGLSKRSVNTPPPLAGTSVAKSGQSKTPNPSDVYGSLPLSFEANTDRSTPRLNSCSRSGYGLFQPKLAQYSLSVELLKFTDPRALIGQPRVHHCNAIAARHRCPNHRRRGIAWQG